MATFKSSSVEAGQTFSGICPPNVVQRVYGKIAIATNPADGDIYQLVKVPAGATVVGGYVRAIDLDTGTETLDMDIGWAANGSEAADPDGFGNLGVWTGDAVAGLKPEVGNYFPLMGVLGVSGPQTFTNETVIQVEANAAANAGGTGALWVVVDFIV